MRGLSWRPSEGRVRTRQDALHSVSYRFCNAVIAVNASVAVTPCTLLHAIARAVAAPTALGLASKYDIDLANGVFCWARSARAAWSLSVASVRDHNQGLALDQCGLGDREVRATAVSTLCRPRSILLSPLAVCNVHSELDPKHRSQSICMVHLLRVGCPSTSLHRPRHLGHR
jgi:hypothetical protein